jgi:UDP-N-acetylglucosamine acyltransferase
VLITGWTTLGEENEIFKGAVIGEAPQDLKYKGEESYTVLGSRNTIREFVTVHRAAEEGATTSIGDDNLLMNYVHVAHNCRLGSQIVIANNVGMAGHVTIEDMATLGGLCGIHQFVRVGKLCMIGGYSKILQDIPPFTLVEGLPVRILGLNVPGLRRRGISSESRLSLKRAVKIMASRKHLLKDLPGVLQNSPELEMTPELEHFIGFISNPSRKGMLMQTPQKSEAQYVEAVSS